jgi:hypothetical protein
MMADETHGDATPSGPDATGGARPRRPRSSGSKSSGSKSPAAAKEQTAVTAALISGAAPKEAAPREAPVEGRAPAPGTAAAADDAARTPGTVRRALTSRRAPRLRTGITVFLVAAALLGVLVSALALWTHTVIFDTDAYVKVVAPVAQDPAVRSSVADYVGAKAVQAVDLNDRLEQGWRRRRSRTPSSSTSSTRSRSSSRPTSRSGSGSTSTASRISNSSRRCGTTTGS